MAVRLSRRNLASYYAEALVNGTSSKNLARELAAYLIEAKRTKELPLIIDDIEHQLACRGSLSARLTSAHALNEASRRSVIDLLRHKTGASDINIKESIDENLLGGLKIEFIGNELDMTISRQLSKLKTNYKK
ncbi:hypothetical protein HGB24_02740 [Candidatus Saccharibacteria bacterium]|nr:hypothetical protein [Candidatus Saccharibacteria bacterium]